MGDADPPVIHKNTVFSISVTNDKYMFFISYLESLLKVLG